VPNSPVHPNDREGRRQQATGVGLQVIDPDGTRYAVHTGEMSSTNRRLFRTQVGMPFSTLAADPGRLDPIDVVAAVVWMARVIAGERIGYESVAEQYGLDDFDQFDIDVVQPPAEVPDPVRVIEGEASATPEA